MSDVTIRTISDADLEPWVRSQVIAFLQPGSEDDVRRWRAHIDLERAWAAEDRGRIVGSCGVLDRRLTLPGGRAVPFAAVTAVSVLPTHRRRGILTRMMAEMLEDGRRRGEPVAALTASESIIYGRYGFGVATFNATHSLETAHAAQRVAPPELDVELLDVAEAVKVLPELYARHRASRPGEVDRTDAVWADVAADPPEHRGGMSAWYVAVCDGGYALYRSRDEGHHDHHMLLGASLHVRDLVAADPGTEAALWRFLCSVDFARTVEVAPAPVEDPFRYRLADPRRLRTLSVTDMLWVRVLDTPAALQARGYTTEGALTLEVLPPAVGGDADPAVGRWRLEAGPEGATCRPATRGEATDLRLGLDDLGSLLLGGVRTSALAAAGRVAVERLGAEAVADALFLTSPAPFTTTGF